MRRLHMPMWLLNATKPNRELRFPTRPSKVAIISMLPYGKRTIGCVGFLSSRVVATLPWNTRRSPKS